MMNKAGPEFFRKYIDILDEQSKEIKGGPGVHGSLGAESGIDATGRWQPPLATRRRIGAEKALSRKERLRKNLDRFGDFKGTRRQFDQEERMRDVERLNRSGEFAEPWQFAPGPGNVE